MSLPIAADFLNASIMSRRHCIFLIAKIVMKIIYVFHVKFFAFNIKNRNFVPDSVSPVVRACGLFTGKGRLRTLSSDFQISQI